MIESGRERREPEGGIEFSLLVHSQTLALVQGKGRQTEFHLGILHEWQVPNT